jgi:hypothetical protein
VREARDNEEAEERSLRFGVEERNVWFMPENLSNSPLTKKNVIPNDPLSETPPESPSHEAREEINHGTIGPEPVARLRLPPRPRAAAATTTTMAVSASQRNIPAVDSCGNLLDPGLVAFAEVSVDVFSLEPLASVGNQNWAVLEGRRSHENRRRRRLSP